MEKDKVLLRWIYKFSYLSYQITLTRWKCIKQKVTSCVMLIIPNFLAGFLQKMYMTKIKLFSVNKAALWILDLPNPPFLPLDQGSSGLVTYSRWLGTPRFTRAIGHRHEHRFARGIKERTCDIAGVNQWLRKKWNFQGCSRKTNVKFLSYESWFLT